MRLSVLCNSIPKKCPPIGYLAKTAASAGGCKMIEIIGGAEEGRTPGLRIANAALCQLSYCPTGKTEYSFEFRVSSYRVAILAIKGLGVPGDLYQF